MKNDIFTNFLDNLWNILDLMVDFCIGDENYE